MPPPANRPLGLWDCCNRGRKGAKGSLVCPVCILLLFRVLVFQTPFQSVCQFKWMLAASLKGRGKHLADAGFLGRMVLRQQGTGRTRAVDPILRKLRRTACRRKSFRSEKPKIAAEKGHLVKNSPGSWSERPTLKGKVEGGIHDNSGFC